MSKVHLVEPIAQIHLEVVHCRITSKLQSFIVAKISFKIWNPVFLKYYHKLSTDPSDYRYPILSLDCRNLIPRHKD